MNEAKKREKFNFFVAMQLMRMGMLLKKDGFDGFIGIQPSSTSHVIMAPNSTQIELGFMVLYDADMKKLPASNEDFAKINWHAQDWDTIEGSVYSLVNDI